MTPIFPIQVIFGASALGSRGSIDIKQNALAIKKGDAVSEIPFQQIEQFHLQHRMMRFHSKSYTRGESFRIKIKAGADSIRCQWDTSWTMEPNQDPVDAVEALISALVEAGLPQTKIKHNKGYIPLILFFGVLGLIAWYTVS